MAEVASYHVLVYGGPDGYQTNRAQIQLSDAAGKTLAWLRYYTCFGRGFFKQPRTADASAIDIPGLMGAWYRGERRSAQRTVEGFWPCGGVPIIIQNNDGRPIRRSRV
jgi:hypothetical protein